MCVCVCENQEENLKYRDKKVEKRSYKDTINWKEKQLGKDREKQTKKSTPKET